MDFTIDLQAVIVFIAGFMLKSLIDQHTTVRKEVAQMRAKRLLDAWKHLRAFWNELEQHKLIVLQFIRDYPQSESSGVVPAGLASRTGPLPEFPLELSVMREEELFEVGWINYLHSSREFVSIQLRDPSTTIHSYRGSITSLQNQIRRDKKRIELLLGVTAQRGIAAIPSWGRHYLSWLLGDSIDALCRWFPRSCRTVRLMWDPGDLPTLHKYQQASVDLAEQLVGQLNNP